MKKLLIILMLLLSYGVSFAGDTTTLTITANVVGTCKFNSSGTISYSLDPFVGTDIVGVVTQPTFWCTKGASFTLSDDNGVNKDGTTYRMKHDTLSEYIPYSLSYTKTGTGAGKKNPITMDIASTVVGTDYVNSSAGNYSDTVILTITP